MVGIIREVIALRKQQKVQAKMAEHEKYLDAHFEERFDKYFEDRFALRFASMGEEELRSLIKAHKPGCHLTNKNTKTKPDKEAHPQETGVSEGGGISK